MRLSVDLFGFVCSNIVKGLTISDNKKRCMSNEFEFVMCRTKKKYLL